MFKALFGGRNVAAPTSSEVPKYDDLAKMSYFTINELKKLFARYQGLKNSSGDVTMEAFCSQPEVVNCRLIILVFEALCPPSGHSKGIIFPEFVLLLSKFSFRAQREEKMKCKNTMNLLSLAFFHKLTVFL